MPQATNFDTPIPARRASECVLRWTVTHLLALRACIFVFAVCGNSFLSAQSTDVVIVRRSDATEPLRRTGTIVDWKADSLTFSTGTSQREIDNTDIIGIETNWPVEYTTAKQQMATGHFAAATTNLQSALSTERRPWAVRIIRANLIRMHGATGNRAAAIQQFLTLIDDDPQTRFFQLCPLQWISGNHNLGEHAAPLMTSPDPVRQLIGASWSLTGTDSETATRVLDKLSRDIQPQIKHLAIAQLWRLRAMNLKTVNAPLISVWESNIESMPAEIRAGPWFVIAETQLRLGEHESAIINFMRIPILYPNASDLSAAALYQAGLLLHNVGSQSESTDSKTIWDELKQKFPQSIWAGQIK
jgi:hypothetical protein